MLTLPRDLRIYIPSRGRAGQLRTLSAMEPRLQAHVTFVVPKLELHEYATQTPRGVHVTTGPNGIANVRQYVATKARYPRYIMLDDDLSFSSSQGGGKYARSHPVEVTQAILWIWNKLHQGYAWAGLSNRFMANTKPPVYENSNPSMAWGVDRNVLDIMGIRFDDIEVCEDWHVCLSLLESGYPNIYTSEHVVAGYAQNKNGGCLPYRDTELVRKSQRDFVFMHPKNSRVVPTQSLQQGCPVGEGLRVQWKKAFERAWGL